MNEDESKSALSYLQRCGYGADFLWVGETWENVDTCIWFSLFLELCYNGGYNRSKKDNHFHRLNLLILIFQHLTVDWMLTQYCAKLFICTDSVNLCNNLWGNMLFFPFYRWRKWDSEIKLLKFMQWLKWLKSRTADYKEFDFILAKGFFLDAW